MQEKLKPLCYIVVSEKVDGFIPFTCAPQYLEVSLLALSNQQPSPLVTKVGWGGGGIPIG